MASDEKTPYVLRPEARPLRWSLLNASQQSAFRKILNALKDARRDVDQASRQKSEEIAPNLPANPDRFRSSRLVFLSGKRGTGKSTVLVSLFEAFLDTVNFCKANDDEKAADTAKTSQNNENAKGNTERSKEVTESETKIAEALQRDLQELCNRLVWLDPLDMEPLPRPVNLLAAILARIDRAAARFNQRREDKTYQSGLLSLASGEKALHGLRKLSSDVAIAWDGNVDARASALDPDAYAAEVTRVEDARVGINAALNKALDELAQELGKSSYVKNPLFVLPVDDYDLNPLRSLELLHLIRMVSSPRLFIIVLGDVRTAEIMFNLKKSGDFARVLEAAYTPKYLSLSPAEIGGIARSLSGHAIRKLVPPGQRIELGVLQVEESLNFHPGHLRKDNTPSTENTLGKFLEKLPVEIETADEPPPPKDLETQEQKALFAREKQSIAGEAIPNFRKFLCFNVLRQEFSSPGSNETAPKQAEAASKSEEERTFPYTGAALLRATPRYIADLWFSIQDLVGDEGSLKPAADQKTLLNMLINFVGMETHRALEEDELLSIRYRERFVEALGISPGEEWLQAMRFVEARSISVPGRVVPFRDQDCILRASYKRSWAFWDQEKERPIDIAERTKALVVLLHDLLALEKGGGIVGSHSLSPNSLEMDWAVASWDLGLQNEVNVPWITPAWTSFWEFDQLSHIWDFALRSNVWHSRDEPRQRAFLLYTWIAGVCRIFQKAEDTELTAAEQSHLTIEASNTVNNPTPAEKPFKTIPDSLDEIGTGDTLWKNLASIIKGLIEESVDTTVRAERIRSWLLRLPVLLAPESGLVATQEHSILESCARTLLNESIWRTFLIDSKGRQITSRIQSIRSLRASRLAPFQDAREKLNMLTDKARPKQTQLVKKHPVNELLKGMLVPTDKDLKRARERLLKKRAKDSQERIAIALEDFTLQLSTILRGADADSQETKI